MNRVYQIILFHKAITSLAEIFFSTDFFAVRVAVELKHKAIRQHHSLNGFRRFLEIQQASHGKLYRERALLFNITTFLLMKVKLHLTLGSRRFDKVPHEWLALIQNRINSILICSFLLSSSCFSLSTKVFFTFNLAFNSKCFSFGPCFSFLNEWLWCAIRSVRLKRTFSLSARTFSYKYCCVLDYSFFSQICSLVIQFFTHLWTFSDTDFVDSLRFLESFFFREMAYQAIQSFTKHIPLVNRGTGSCERLLLCP